MNGTSDKPNEILPQNTDHPTAENRPCENSLSRREALNSLAKLSVYSAPTVTTLLTAQLSYAQTSQAVNSPDPTVMTIVNICRQGFFRDLGRFRGQRLGNNLGWFGTDDASDCGR